MDTGLLFDRDRLRLSSCAASRATFLRLTVLSGPIRLGVSLVGASSEKDDKARDKAYDKVSPAGR